MAILPCEFWPEGDKYRSRRNTATAEWGVGGGPFALAGTRKSVSLGQERIGHRAPGNKSSH